MKIVFDCFKLVKGVGKSIGIYNLAKSMVANLAKSQKSVKGERQKSYELIVIGNEYNRPDFDISGVQFVLEEIFNPLKKIDCIIWELLVVSRRAKILQADRIVFPRGFAPLMRSGKDIIVIHDLIPFYYAEHYPDYFKKLENFYIMNRLKASAVNCHKIITISEASKRDILKYIHVNKDKIEVIHNGCNEMENIDKESMPNKYIVAVASDLPHKNSGGSIKSYEAYCQYSQAPLELVVIGFDNLDRYELSAEIKSKITCYKYIEDNREMHQLITNASVFLFLSFIEGFGFPPIEAMQLGVPVICSNRSSLPEIVGDAAILVEPDNYKEIGRQLDGLIKNQNLQRQLIKKGYENVSRFSWNTRAEKYWDAIVK